MDKQQHTPEPWRMTTGKAGSDAIQVWHDFERVAECNVSRAVRRQEQIANARRIVACVNACAGIPTEQLEAAGTIAVECQDEMQAELLKAWKQRDDLLAAMIEARKALQLANEIQNGPICDTIWYSNCETLFDFMDAAIASVKEKK